ncbi:type II toxin-antitoxin system death-on-curing family toxin [Actinokineospora xionganensis]|uniref:Type II toxin-antitoxin system death-on-curing family toxin n=1 Tax=Actinokineospora xionganensis TaxID=2684470 RepID=A0ABR7LF75_9PSEU|nr:type II toxin-antitoxin system death-on-curing family toxin [Actinokineospora xionganensis]MBC6451148.1 type II toxin-antitoxin system death-on-curing family toxin [Actinokineospora xionganensis]
MTVDYPTVEDLLSVAADLNADQVRDLGLLESAAHRPRTAVMGQDAYDSLHEKAAVLLQSVVRNHALVDGNKRLSWMAAFVFLGLNGIDLDAPEDDAYDVVIAASTGSIDHTEIAAHLTRWTRPIAVSPA